MAGVQIGECESTATAADASSAFPLMYICGLASMALLVLVLVLFFLARFSRVRAASTQPEPKLVELVELCPATEVEGDNAPVPAPSDVIVPDQERAVHAAVVLLQSKIRCWLERINYGTGPSQSSGPSCSLPTAPANTLRASMSATTMLPFTCSVPSYTFKLSFFFAALLTNFHPFLKSPFAHSRGTPPLNTSPVRA